MNRIWAILLFALITGPVLSQSIPVPDIEGRVTDQTGTLSSSEISDLEIKLGKFYEGVDAGIDELIRRINRDPLPPPNPEDFLTFEKKEAPKEEKVPF